MLHCRVRARSVVSVIKIERDDELAASICYECVAGCALRAHSTIRPGNFGAVGVCGSQAKLSYNLILTAHRLFLNIYNTYTYKTHPYIYISYQMQKARACSATFAATQHTVTAFARHISHVNHGQRTSSVSSYMPTSFRVNLPV